MADPSVLNAIGAIQIPRMALKPGNLSDSIELRFIDSRFGLTGKGLHTDVSIKAGKLVARISKPLFNIVGLLFRGCPSIADPSPR